MTNEDEIREGIEHRFSNVEPLLPRTPHWRAPEEPTPTATIRLVAGPAVRTARAPDRRLPLVAAAIVVLLVGGWWFAGTPSVPSAGTGAPDPTADPTRRPSATVDTAPGSAEAFRPAIEPRLVVPTAPDAWTVVDDRADALHLVHLLQDVGAGGFNVTAAMFEPHGVYDPLEETKRLPLPADLIGWIAVHPDVDADLPETLVVSGLLATSIDATVTYQPGPRGQTAQFIDIGAMSWNLESPSRKRMILVELPDRPLLIVYDARPELFDRGIAQFERWLRGIQFLESPPP